MQLPSVTDGGFPDEYLGAPARMPRQVLRRAENHVKSAGARDDSDRLEGICCFHPPARAPGTARFTQAGQDRGDLLGLPGQGLVEHSDLNVRRPAVDGNEPNAAGLLGGLDDLRSREQRGVNKSSRYVARQSFQ